MMSQGPSSLSNAGDKLPCLPKFRYIFWIFNNKLIRFRKLYQRISYDMYETRNALSSINEWRQYIPSIPIAPNSLQYSIDRPSTYVRNSKQHIEFDQKWSEIYFWRINEMRIEVDPIQKSTVVYVHCCHVYAAAISRKWNEKNCSRRVQAQHGWQSCLPKMKNFAICISPTIGRTDGK